MNEKVLNGARKLIVDFFKERREELGLTQGELAERTALGIGIIKRFENASLWPSLKQYLIICEALHLIPLVATFEGSDDMSREMRDTWTRNQGKDMSIEEALQLKKKGHVRPDSEN